MRYLVMTALGLTCLTAQSVAQDSISPKTLAIIKGATVFLKVDVKGLEGSGTGFVTNVDGDSALIVTNHHVIEPKVQMVVQPRPPIGKSRPGTLPPPTFSPRMIVTTLKNASVTVVLASGTKKERSFKAEVLAADPERDLAILRIKDVKDLPAPIDVSKAPELAETLPVYTFGFPFGKVLATSKGSPAITVGKATISSLRENDEGDLAYVQIDGALNPGNSGGPVVDVNGKLVGVAVATIRNSTGIGLAVPGAELRKMFAGRLGVIHLSTAPGDKGKLTVNVEVALIDPLNKISSVTLHWVPGSRTSDKTIESLAKVEGVQKIELTIEKQIAVGKITLDAGANEKELLLEPIYSNEPGKTAKVKVVRQSLKQESIAKTKTNSDMGDKDGLTRILGGAFDPQFKDEPPEGSLLVGLELGMGKFFDKDVIKAVRPIYRDAKEKEVMGKQYGTKLTRVVTVKAKAGYAVGGAEVRAGLGIDAVTVTFMRLKGDRLDPDDSYKSEFIGGMGGSPTVLGGDGTPVIGIIGKSNKDDCTGIGLLLKKKGVN